jgi:pyruvate-formate lyase
MYEFRPATDRIKQIRELVRSRVIRFDAERALIATESNKRYENVVPIIRRPLVTRDVCSKMTVRVEDNDIFVGNRGKHFRDIKGPTAVFNSTICFDHSHFMDGIALNIRIHPSSLKTDEDKALLRVMTQTYFENGGLEVQYNIVSSETLRAAQKDPAAYRNLVVRIAGYSAYFVELAKNLQNDIIARTENSLR